MKLLLAKLSVLAAVAVAAFAAPALAQPPSHAKAYGKHCQGKSKKHTPHGDKGTEFSRCVKGAHSSGKPSVKAHNEGDENDNDQDENENENENENDD